MQNNVFKCIKERSHKFQKQTNLFNREPEFMKKAYPFSNKDNSK